MQRYHRWLESLQSLDTTGSRSEMDVDVRLMEMEESVVQQARELQLTKELFVKDFKQAQSALRSQPSCPCWH